MMERIHSVLKPGGVLLGFFHTREAGAAASRSQQEPSANIGRIETAPSADKPKNRPK